MTIAIERRRWPTSSARCSARERRENVLRPEEEDGREDQQPGERPVAAARGAVAGLPAARRAQPRGADRWLRTDGAARRRVTGVPPTVP